MNDKFVLLVEDNQDDVDLTRIAFKKCQIPDELIVVEDGQEALDFLFGEGQYAGRDTSQLPAVVLLDLKLPYVSGVEVLRRVRMADGKICRLPIVVLSSSVNQQEINECERMGINRYCRKPDNFAAFQRIIEDIRDSFLERDRNQTEVKRNGIIIPDGKHSG
jgi:two-component system, response regulator